jgi:hypothetical protein
MRGGGPLPLLDACPRNSAPVAGRTRGRLASWCCGSEPVPAPRDDQCAGTLALAIGVAARDGWRSGHAVERLGPPNDHRGDARHPKTLVERDEGFVAHEIDHVAIVEPGE